MNRDWPAAVGEVPGVWSALGVGCWVGAGLVKTGGGGDGADRGGDWVRGIPGWDGGSRGDDGWLRLISDMPDGC